MTDPSAGDDAGGSEDSRLVEAARQGDRAAFGRLYDRYARMVHGILLAKVPLREVDDIVHDAFLQALRQLHTLRDVARFGAWLAAIARNRANDYHRRAVEEVELPDSLSHDQVAGSTAGNRQDRDDEAAFLLAAIRELPETYREPLLLRLVEGMTGPEIAARTGLTPGSVRVNLHRGMQQLREKLASTARVPQEGSI
ncbi:MAG TPA: sigma-70 family RNA polymerase sigma factor [Candidatus Angelobacter sp.]